MEHFTPAEAPIHETQRLPVIPPRQIIGRNSALGQAFAQMRAGAAVLLSGPAGVGKSALAATLASAFTTFSGGVLWWTVEQDTLADLLVRLGRAYNEPALTRAADPLAELELAQALLSRENKPLIVLDGDLNPDVAREFVRKVAGSVPLILTAAAGGAGPWIPLALDTLSEDDAVSLYVAASGNDQISSVMRADIQGVCNALDDLPLAVMLAGRHAQVTGQTPGEFLGALTSVSVRHGLPGLHTIFHQIPDALQGMLLTMGATFAGQATTALLEYLQLSPTDTVNRVMNMLVSRGLAQRLPCYTDSTCYGVHESIYHYARSWLEDTQRLEATVERVREGVLAYAEQHRYNTREARTNLVAEMPNILGLAREAAVLGDAVTLQRVIAVLEAAFGDVGAYDFELRQLRSSLESTLSAGDAVGAAMPEQPALFETDVFDESLSVDVIDEAPVSETLAEVPLVDDEIGTGEAPSLEEEFPGAFEGELEPEFEEVLPDFMAFDSPAADDALLEVPSLSPEPVAAPGSDGSLGMALADLLKASQQAREAGDHRALARALTMLGRTWQERGQDAQAHAAFAEAQAICEREGDIDGLLEVLETLAGVALDSGDMENAVVYATRAENLAAEYQITARQGHLLALLGDIRLELGDLDGAISTYVEAIETLQSAGDPISLGVVQTKLGSAYLDRSDYTRAVAMLTGALEVFEAAGRPEYQGRVRGSLGTAYGHLAQWSEAAENHRQALEIARELGDVEEQERQLANLAYVAQSRGERGAMIAHYRSALALAYREERGDWQVRYLDVLGQMLMDDVTLVGLAVMCLEEADQLEPDPERERWLQRARRRYDRIRNAGISHTALPASVQVWAVGEGYSEVEVES